MKQLIINSDDYGRTPEISRGIREAHLRGVVTSTTCMMNIPTTAEDIVIALRESPTLRMGVHLVLTMGDPISEPEVVRSITDENGHFFKYAALVEHLPTLDVGEVKREWREQIDAFIRASGRKPTHLDSHHHSSYFSPQLFQGMLELAREYDCAIREILLDIIQRVPEGTTEVMCHPGYTDEQFANESVYNNQRDRELEILTDPSIKEAIQANGIQLISFAEL